MSLNYGQNTVTTAAEILVPANSRRKSLLVQNVHATNDLYVGADANVTTANGLKVAAGQSLEFLTHDDVIWGIASAVGTDVRYLEEF